MYTEMKAYQLVIAMLKKYDIKDLVLSAGSRNVPFVHSVEKDDFFNCYSVVDERSAGYFALGLSQEKNKPVLISCTASTASCNYYPPVAEAFYQNVPMIILTSDRNPHMLGQREDQMIDQVNMFDRHVKKSVNLPIINNKEDEKYCVRLLNEAFLELNHNGLTGTVHINVPMNSYNRTFNVKELPEINKITRVEINDKILWNEKIEKLNSFKKIMLICGQCSYVSDELKVSITEFFQNYNSAIIVDHMSNLDAEYGINTIMTFDENYINAEKFNELMPDLVISFGGQVFSGIKGHLRKNYTKFEHWSIYERGEVCDLFKGLTTIFECKPEFFFDQINKNATSLNDMKYYNDLLAYNSKAKIPQLPYSNVYAIKGVVESIPSNSILHLSINDSIRISNFFKLNSGIKTYSNIGTYGIDGCMSSFIGQSVASPDKQAYLIIGDLSFFYDMNSIKINSLGDNVHILLLNNSGAAEFYYNKTWIDKDSDRHTSARHNIKAEGWVRENGIEYISSRNKEEFDMNLERFISGKGPVLFEVFTEMSSDAKTVYDVYDHSRPISAKGEATKKLKSFVKEKTGQEKAKKILDILKNN
ncbi:2-succinyl-5-enolpyruvyl-6-hydroxy-3-cyclohexene-1-carboxylic-acid synthase [Acetobacterium woodii]|uniref:2-succinyl-5-enolpyruvyl-6-hydroxy-3-cyclohexene-1-carboxylate synthase MenD n=1 Tax=Acetobacterium woodii (strain ATCC 29683 / DSM 1030 / JCM 2381 / KCTC 1655 / WB1) TaxID=931626 RepID=H6LEL3_ACEWD|nr:2-succinyl-5-enolpyruvyl-6-hydroxy-3-cyclohexene-1-carboxylic-acid synthase [Acetobacterium woodii]AFA48116.1 2-succinyl-5-enolpyruvyl-6-hydroxy-3-cyclohexene-1-carboxylate synthase MenD [Acetobacterium woodii DSM 1030]